MRQLRANLRVVTGGRAVRAGARRRSPRGRCAPTPATGRRRSGCRRWAASGSSPDTEVLGLEHVQQARGSGRGVVLALPHSGNWDAAGVWFVDWLGGPFMTVAERLKPESLYRRFLDYRESLGMRVVPLTGGPRPSTEVLREWLSDGGVALPARRPEPRHRRRAGRLLRPAGDRCPAGPALLAAQTGAALLPAVCQFTERGLAARSAPRGAGRPAPGRLKDRVADRDAVGRRRLRRGHRRAARGLAHARPDLGRRAARPPRPAAPAEPAR